MPTCETAGRSAVLAAADACSYLFDLRIAGPQLLLHHVSSSLLTPLPTLMPMITCPATSRQAWADVRKGEHPHDGELWCGGKLCCRKNSGWRSVRRFMSNNMDRRVRNNP